MARSTYWFGLAVRFRIAVFAGLALLLLLTAAPRAAYADACTRTITQCPCTINASGKFKVMNPLASASLTKDCITVAAQHVSLDLAGNALTGPGSTTPTAGIHVFRRADHVTITGGGAMITKFGSGILIEGDRAAASGFSATGNQNGLVIAGDGGQHTGFDASGNSNDGVLFSAASGNVLSSFTADDNTIGNGVELTSGSNHDSLSGFTASSNGAAGVDVHKTGCTGSCRDMLTSVPSQIQVTAGTVTGNGTYGVVVFDGHRATITDNSATSNLTKDLFDANRGCDHNHWFGNTFTAANRGCIN